MICEGLAGRPISYDSREVRLALARAVDTEMLKEDNLDMGFSLFLLVFCRIQYNTGKALFQ